MASLGQTVAGFLLLTFCLCCFYQPCLSNPNLLNNNCLSFPPNCLDGGTNVLALQPICLYLKNSENLCLPQSNQATTSDVPVCDKLSELAPQIIKSSSCPVFCQTFVDICQYLYLTEKIKLTGKTDSDFSQNETTINRDNNVIYKESKRNNIKLVKVPSKKKNIDNKITTTGFHSITSGSDIGKIPDTVSSGNQSNSSNSPKGSGETHVDDAKTNNQSVFQNPPNIVTQPNFRFQLSGSQNLSNTRNGPNIEIPHVSINISKTGSGAANTGDRPNSSISLKGTVSPDNVGKTHVEDAKTDTQSPVFQNPLNTGNQPNSNNTLKGSTITNNVGKTHVDDAKTDNQSVFQNPPNTGIDASKTSDTRANISPSEDQAIQNRFDSQQSTKLSIGNKPDIVPKKTPVSTAYNEAPSSAHFMGYFLTAIVLCIAGYIVFHNKQKIIAFIIEGRNQKRGRRPNANEYKKLQTNVDDVMVSLDKSTTAQNYIY